MDNNPINPLIYQNPPGSSKANPLRTWLPRIIILLLLGVVVFQLVRSNQSLTQPSAKKFLPTQPPSSGTIILVEPNKTYQVGQDITIPVRIVTGGHTIQGVDLVIKYDPKVLAALTPALSTTKLMSEYPTNQADPIHGLIRVSGIASTQQVGFNGAGIFGTLNFKPTDKGKTTVSIDFKLNNTADSNMIELATGQDILGSANSLDLTIN